MLLVSQLVLVLMLMLDAYATGFCTGIIAIVYSIFNKNRSSGTHCVVTLFKAKVISRVNVEYQFVRFQNTVCKFVEQWNTYNVLCKVENDNIVFNLWIQNCYCLYLIFKDYSIFRIDI